MWILVVSILDGAHIVSPMVLAWSHTGLRQIVSREWVRHIVIPIGVMIVVLVFPRTWVTGPLFAWNIFHYGMQHFGVASLCKLGKDRELRALICVGGTALCMGVVPFVFPNYYFNMLLWSVFTLTHGLTDIGLSSRVARWHWGFVGLVLMISISWFLLRNGPLSVRVVPHIIDVRNGIVLMHFIYSARIWKLSDPLVRAAIGRDLLPRPAFASSGR